VPAQLQGFLLGNSHELEAWPSNSQSVARSDCDLEVYSYKMIRVRLTTPGVEEPISIKEG
jgi:pyrroloquinoline quinone (PQQ) biosynthesis protein C